MQVIYRLIRLAMIGAALLAGSLPASAASSRPGELKASIEFAKASDQYLLVYSSNEISSGPNVYGRLLNADGSPSGKDFRVSTQAGEMSKPVLAYNSQAERFLVVWGRKLFGEDRAEIIGLNLGLDGKVIGQEFKISVSDLYDQRPAIAYCPGRDRYLVTWTRGLQYDYEHGISDVYGQFIEGGSAHLRGGNFVIASKGKNQFKSEVDCDVVNDRFLVVWEDQRQRVTQDDIYGQLISSDGAMLGQNFLIAGTENVERRPSVAANTKNGTYLVVWESVVKGQPRLFSQTIDSNGHLQREPLPIGSELGGGRNRPAVAYLKQQDVFLVAFANSKFGTMPDGIWGQFVEGSGKLRDPALALTTARMEQFRPDVAAARNTFLVVWTDYRDAEGDTASDTAGGGGKRKVYEYYGRVIGGDRALSARWRNPESK